MVNISDFTLTKLVVGIKKKDFTSQEVTESFISSSEKSKKSGKCYYDFTWKQLESWGCKFHDLSTGTKGKYIKPPYDMVIDDKAKRIEEL